jgi:ABC-2 type transport system permease protein
LRRILNVYKVFLTSSLVRELEFRANFIAKIVQNMVWVGWFLMVLLVVYRNTDSVAGWGRGEGFILGSTTFILSAIFGLFFRSMLEIPDMIRRGTLDFVLTKPVDSQFWACTRRFNFDQIGSFIAGTLMLWYGIGQFGQPIAIDQWFGFVVLLLCALAIFFAMNTVFMITSVWFVRVDNLWVLSETSLDVSRFPIDIFGASIQRALVYYIPLAFLATMPARQLVRGFDPAMLTLGVAWAAFALLASRLFWSFALKHYSSASS